MEAAARERFAQMQDKLHILEDLNMLYIRQIALSLEGTDIQRKIDHEIRMREGACKLLAACTQRQQALEVTKSLLVCNSRILAYMAELQRMKEAQVMQRMARRPSDAGPMDDRLPCRGKVCLSDLRIPLMWKDTEYFKNKGDLHRCAVFCLLQIGTEIYDTEMVLVDRTLTDICFENPVLFTEAGPDFELKLELYSAGLEEDSALGNTPKKLASRLSSSLGRSSGKRVRAALEGGSPGSPVSNGGSSPLLLPAPPVPGPKYQLLACTTLRLAHVQDAFRTHDLTVMGDEESSFWLPLYGSVCCRLTAQPNCLVQEMMGGFLKVQGRERLFCLLRGPRLFCYRHPHEAETQEEPALTIAVNKETRIRATEKDPKNRLHCMTITNRYGDEEVTHTLLAESRAETQRWMEAFWQHFYDLSQWKHCCEELMKVEVPSPRRPPALLPKQGSLYHEMAIEPADDIEAVTEILARRVSGLGDPAWLSLFDRASGGGSGGGGGSSRGSSGSSSNGGSSSASPRPPHPPWGRPRTLSLDAKLSTLKGRSGRPPRPPSPRAWGSPSRSSSSSSGSPTPEPERGPQPHPRPRFDPHLWLQSQV
uniref:Rhotekin isoform X2 n=1 Tax=Pogona vitticeps TaxID=103695 RepID=A0ABM5GL32_9SAUR